MRYYFAGRYRRHAELAGYRAELQAAIPDARVTSRWIDQHDGELEASYTAEGLAADPAACWRHGSVDLYDLMDADAIVQFTGDNDGYVTGGRHVEYGVAMAWISPKSTLQYRPTGMRLILVGPRENVFHCHPATEVYPTWADFLAHEVAAARQTLTEGAPPVAGTFCDRHFSWLCGRGQGECQREAAGREDH